MAFTQPCFIKKNTPELRKKLKELGYNRYPLWMADWDDDDSRYIYLATAIDVYNNKTTLEITYRDSVAIDSMVVYKPEFRKY